MITFIDYETDKIIQESIRRELKDVTLITVAHRLQTIMDADRIVSLSLFLDSTFAFSRLLASNLASNLSCT